MTNAQRNHQVLKALEKLLLQLETQLGNAYIYDDVSDDTINDTISLIKSTEAAIEQRLNEWAHAERASEGMDKFIDERPIPCHTVILGIAVALKKQREKELHPEIAQCKIDDYSIIDEQ